MIVCNDTNPEKDIYYIGALLIEVLTESDKNYVDFIDAFQSLNEIKKISMPIYTLTLDWLFLIGAIKWNDRQIIKCF